VPPSLFPQMRIMGSRDEWLAGRIAGDCERNLDNPRHAERGGRLERCAIRGMGELWAGSEHAGNAILVASWGGAGSWSRRLSRRYECAMTTLSVIFRGAVDAGVGELHVAGALSVRWVIYERGLGKTVFGSVSEFWLAGADRGFGEDCSFSIC